MQTKSGSGIAPAGSIFSGEGAGMADEIDFRMLRLAGEAQRELMAGPRDGLRQRIGHVVMALGRMIHGIEPEQATRRALRTR